MSFSLKLQRKTGTTSCVLEIFIENSASAGAGKTGLAYNTSSLVAYYKRNLDATPVAITLADCTLGTFTSGGFKEVDATNMPGVYELHIPDAALAAGADNVLIMLKGASGMFAAVLQIELTAINNQDAVRGGMTALPNHACSVNASLLTSGTGTDQIEVDNAGGVNALNPQALNTLINTIAAHV